MPPVPQTLTSLRSPPVRWAHRVSDLRLRQGPQGKPKASDRSMFPPPWQTGDVLIRPEIRLYPHLLSDLKSKTASLACNNPTPSQCTIPKLQKSARGQVGCRSPGAAFAGPGRRPTGEGAKRQGTRDGCPYYHLVNAASAPLSCQQHFRRPEGAFGFEPDEVYARGGVAA